MSRWTLPLRVLPILLTLLAAVIVPVFISGYSDLSCAQDSDGSRGFGGPNYAKAAECYQSAARKLPWEPGLLEKSAIAMSHVDSLRAIALFGQAQARAPLSAEGWDRYGDLYWAVGNDSLALNTWLAGVQRFPGYSGFYFGLWIAYSNLQDFGSAQVWLEKWVATGQATAADHFGLGALLLTSDPQRARKELAQAASMDTNFGPVVETLDASLDLAAQDADAPRRLVILGRALGLVNNWPLAQNAFQQAVNADPHDAQAWAWLGEARQQNKLDGKDALDIALSLDPNNTLVRALRGLYWKRQGKYSAQLAEYQRAAQLEPENPEWQAALGEAYALSGDLVMSLACYQKATLLAPDNAVYWRLLAMFSADNGIQVLDIGLPAAKKAADLAPHDPQALDALGWSYAQAGLLQNAEQTLIKAIGLTPTSALSHFHLAETYLRKGDQASARREFVVVTQLDPGGATGALATQLLKQYFP